MSKNTLIDQKLLQLSRVSIYLNLSKHCWLLLLEIIPMWKKNAITWLFIIYVYTYHNYSNKERPLIQPMWISSWFPPIPHQICNEFLYKLPTMAAAVECLNTSLGGQIFLRSIPVKDQI